MDWISVGIIGFVFITYLELLPAAAFCVYFCIWMVHDQCVPKYKITDIYSIDAALVGPTELKIHHLFFPDFGNFIPNALAYFAVTGSAILIIINLVETNKIIKYGDQRDIEEKKESN